MVEDPACGVEMDERKAVAKLVSKGETHYFFTPVCQGVLDSLPGLCAGGS